MIENTLSDVKLMLPDGFFAVGACVGGGVCLGTNLYRLLTIFTMHYVAEFIFYLRKETIYFLLHI